MSFEGLQGLLKRKKTEHPRQQQVSSELPSSVAVGISSLPQAPAFPDSVVEADKRVRTATTGNTASSSSVSCDHFSPTSDPYATVLQRVQTLQQQEHEQKERAVCDATANQKRSRGDMAQGLTAGEEERTSHTGPSCSEVSAKSTPTADVCVSAALADLTRASVTPPLKDDEAVLQQREMGVAVLHMCLTQLEHCWRTERASRKIAVSAASRREHRLPCSNTSLEQSVSTAASSVLGIPKALRDYLLAYGSERSPVATRATGIPEVTVVDGEFELLAELEAELRDESQKEVTDSALTAGADVHSVPEEQRHLLELLRALWYLIALLWQHSLDPHQHGGRCSVELTSVSREGSLAPAQQGWSPVVYRAIQNALPADVRLLHGRSIAEEVSRWRALARTRRDALELLSYVCSDYETLVKGSSPSTTAMEFIIPPDLRTSLHTMVVRHLQQGRSFMAVRQDYVDMTMGTANWKLGLFSGGEVHMRRSMERVERNRIAHLLNNEHATHLLQAVRELTIFVEQHAPAKEAAFFCPANIPSSMNA